MRKPRYRESRVCRVLGNPVVYATILILKERGPTSQSDIAKAVRRRLPTMSGHLATLRGMDLVCYERKGGKTRYWLKHTQETKRLLMALRALIRVSRHMPG